MEKLKLNQPISIIPQVQCQNNGHEGMEGPHMDLRLWVPRMSPLNRNSWIVVEMNEERAFIEIDDGAISIDNEFHKYIKPERKRFEITPNTLINFRIFDNNINSGAFVAERDFWTGDCDLNPDPRPDQALDN